MMKNLLTCLSVCVLTIWYFQPFGNAGLQSPKDLPSPWPVSTAKYRTLRKIPSLTWLHMYLDSIWMTLDGCSWLFSSYASRLDVRGYARACECKTRSMNYGPIIIAEQHNIAYMLGGIQQLRGQEEGEWGSAKSPCLSTRGKGSLECPYGPKPSHFRKYSILLSSVHCIGWYKRNKITLNWIELMI